MIEKIIGNENTAIIVTSWRKDHLISGSSSIELYTLCKNKGWKLFINSRIHSKIYSRSLEDCYIGSANCTNNALTSPVGNIETLWYVESLSPENRIEINEIIFSSTLVDDEIYKTYSNWFKSLDNSLIEIEDPEIPLYRSYPLTILPATDDPELMLRYLQNPMKFEHMYQNIEHDIAIYGCISSQTPENYTKIIKQQFLNNEFINKILEQISDSGVSFGTLTQFVHNYCTDVPSPYRKSVKLAVHNTINWIVKLFPETYYIEVPGKHSQVIYKKD